MWIVWLSIKAKYWHTSSLGGSGEISGGVAGWGRLALRRHKAAVYKMHNSWWGIPSGNLANNELQSSNGG